MWNIPLFPEQASTIAGKVDAQYFALILLSAMFAVPVTVLIIFFAIRYRTGSTADRSHPPHTDMRLEMSWIVIPLALSIGFFTWAASVYLEMSRPPAQSLNYYAVGKQWMWKFQHPSGQREINELHIPVGQPIKMIMSSQDVIHSFYIPAFRIKQDVLPGRYTETWFEATKTGEFYLHCTEYCGAQHATMGGRIVVMEAVQYQEWLTSGNVNEGEGAGTTDEPASLEAAGEQAFTSLGCSGCHNPTGGGVGPSLAGIFGQPQPLEGGETVIADEQYIRESILNPQATIVAGFEPVMPSYQGQISEDELMQLIEYIRALESTAEPGSEQ